jgi:ABC-type phosphate/phosphonate transport system substrate-binding protein
MQFPGFWLFICIILGHHGSLDAPSPWDLPVWAITGLPNVKGFLMPPPNARFRKPQFGLMLAVWTVGGLCLVGSPLVLGYQNPPNVLRIGSSSSLAPQNSDKMKDEAGVATLKDFIKEETGFNNEIVQEKDWRELADKMAKGQVHLGVFQGYEFAWAQEKTPKLKPLALAVDVYTYPVAYVIVKKENSAKKFADLKGQSLALPNTGQRYLNLFVETQVNGKLDTFFSKAKPYTNVEDAIDDVVDGVIQAVVADRALLEAYKSSKPGRFKQLKDVAHSQPFPPALIAYYDNGLDNDTLRRFETGVLGANKKEKGQTLLSLFKLTGFEKVPADFGKIIAQTQKDYPAPNSAAK